MFNQVIETAKKKELKLSYLKMESNERYIEKNKSRTKKQNKHTDFQSNSRFSSNKKWCLTWEV
jgi:hypothetical protein